MLNIFIITTNKISRLTECEEWESIIKPNIKNISNLKKEKTGKYPSITSRANFRCLDIIEAIF